MLDENKQTRRRPTVEANAFLDYLHETTRTSALADALTEILNLRRAISMRRMVLVPIPIARHADTRVAV